MPRPRELEITVLAYAPHFLGLAAAAAAERLKAKVSQISDISDAAGPTAPDNVGGDGDGHAAPAAQNRSANRCSKAARAGGEGGALGSVPTGLSPSAVWPDEEAARKKADVERFRGDPVRVGAIVVAAKDVVLLRLWGLFVYSWRCPLGVVCCFGARTRARCV